MAQPDFFEALRTSFMQAIPHARECGIVVGALDAGGARAHLPYREAWLGDTGRGVYHTGIITTFVDTLGGVAVMAAAGRLEGIATLDLRMDFLRPARQGDDLRAHAHCYRLTRSIAFVRATVWQADEAEPVAVSHATFMRATGAPPR